MKGIISYIDHTRGFGRIRYADAKNIQFTSDHVVDLGGFEILRHHEWVTFELVKRDGRLQAINIKRVS